jgi:hypothetical protein
MMTNIPLNHYRVGELMYQPAPFAATRKPLENLYLCAFSREAQDFQSGQKQVIAGN